MSEVPVAEPPAPAGEPPPPVGAPPAPAVEPSRFIDRMYRLHEKLGEGGMGAVYRASPLLGGRTVALKVIGKRHLAAGGQGGQGGQGGEDGQTELLAALAREFQTLASLHHPNIIQVLDYGFDHELGPYFTMELMPSLRSLVAASVGKSLERRVELFAQLLRAVAYLHRRGVIHRDLKPNNVLCVGDRVKVVDFGLATTDPTEAQVAGTIEYMAPELFQGDRPSVRSDLYALGVIADSLLLGRRTSIDERQLALEQARTQTVAQGSVGSAPGGTSATTAVLGPRPDAAAAGEASPPETFGGALAADPARTRALLGIVRKLRAANPADRFASASEVLVALGQAMGADLPIETEATRESFLQASEFIGREAEMARFAAAFDGALRGAGSAFLVAGESGVGKSRLASELRTLALVRGAAAAYGQGVSEGSRSYEVWLPVLRSLALRADLPDDEAAVLKELVLDLPDLVQRSIPDAPRLPPAEAQARLAEVIASLLGRQPRPVVILLEDLQWAREDSLTLFARIAAAAPGLPLLLVGTYRDDEAPELAAKVPQAQPIRLERLGPPQIARLSRSMLGRAGERPEIVEFLSRETEGNLFFLVEVVRALAEQAGQLDRVGDVPLPRQVLTGGIKELARRRVDRLPAADRAHLDLAATAGRRLDLAVLRALLPGVDLDAWLVTCANAAVLESQGEDWRFAHDKLREAILESLPAARRAELHGRIARALEEVYAGADRDARSAALAHHFLEAGDLARGAEYARGAGDIATRLCSYGEARAHYDAAASALARLPDTDDNRRGRIDLLCKQIYTALVTDPAEQNFQRAALARALLAAIAPDAELLPEDRMRLARVHYFYGRIHFYRAETHQAIEYYRKVLDTGQESGDDELIGLPSCLIGTAMTVQGNALAGEPLLARSIDPLQRQGEPFEWFRAVGYHGLSLVLQGRYREGTRQLERVVARAKEIQQPSLLSASHIMTGSTHLLAGDWPVAAEFLRDALAYATRTGDKLHLNLAWSGLGWAQSHQGLHGEAAAARAVARDIATTMGGRLMLDDWYRAGDAEIAFNAGRWDLAGELAETVAAQSGASGLLLSQGIAERVWADVLARRGQNDEADTHFDRSLAAFDRGGLRVQAARTRLHRALALADRGSPAAAHAYAEARDHIERFGCPHALTEAERRWAAKRSS